MIKHSKIKSCVQLSKTHHCLLVFPYWFNKIKCVKWLFQTKIEDNGPFFLVTGGEKKKKKFWQKNFKLLRIK